MRNSDSIQPISGSKIIVWGAGGEVVFESILDGVLVPDILAALET